MRTIEMNGRLLWVTSLLLLPAVLTGECAPAAAAAGANDVLLNLFIEKGFVSRAEAEKVQQEAIRRQAELDQVKAEAEQYKTELEQVKSDLATIKAQAENYPTHGADPRPASQWLVSSGTKALEFFGDARLRYEARQLQDSRADAIDLNRYRYSLRAGLRGNLFDDFYYGFRLETSSNPRSSWNTFGSSGSANPFGKSTAGINVGQLYLGWKYADLAEITLGKMPNPLYTTPLVWSSSLNLEGAAERFKYTVGDADLFANFGQFLYQDTNPTKTTEGYSGLLHRDGGDLPFLLALQGGVDYHFTKTIDFKVAPVLYAYVGFKHRGVPGTGYQVDDGQDLDGTYVGQGAVSGLNSKPADYNYGNFGGYYANQTAVNDLMVVEVPFGLNLKVKKVNLRLFGDYAVNLEGKQRATAAFDAQNAGYFTDPTTGYGDIMSRISSPQTDDTHAYQFGFSIGSTNLVYGPMQGLVFGNTSKKHAWELRTFWQHIEQYSLDPNLLDADFFDGRENMEGVYAALAYGLSDNVVIAARYGYAHRINNQLGTGGSGGDVTVMNPIYNYNLFQVDLGVRF